MGEISLNIYKKDSKKEIEKTYTADGYELMFGTVEDILEVIDIDKINDDLAVAAMVVKSFNQLKPFLKDVFPEVTDDELKRTKVADLILTFKQIISSIGESIGLLKSGN